MFRDFTLKECLTMRDALKENNVTMRSRNGIVQCSHAEKLNQLAQELTPAQYTAHPYVIASGLIKELDAAILKKG